MNSKTIEDLKWDEKSHKSKFYYRHKFDNIEEAKHLYGQITLRKLLVINGKSIIPTGKFLDPSYDKNTYTVEIIGIELVIQK